MEKELIKYIKTELENLKFKGDSVTLGNVYPALLEKAIGKFNDNYELNGYDCDYWAKTDKYEICGCMRYGNADITLKTGIEKPILDENLSKKDEKVNNDESIVEISLTEEELEEKLKNKELTTFYLTFANNTYIIFYAKDEKVLREMIYKLFKTNWCSIYNEEKGKKLLEDYKGIYFEKNKPIIIL